MVAVRFHIGASGPVKAAPGPPRRSHSAKMAVPRQNRLLDKDFLIQKLLSGETLLFFICHCKPVTPPDAMQ